MAYATTDYGYIIKADGTQIGLASQSDVSALTASSYDGSITLPDEGSTIAVADIIYVKLYSPATTLPTYFCRYFGNLVEVDLSRSNITSIPNYFLARCSSLKTLKLNHKIKTIGSYFLQYCETFNQRLDFADISREAGELDIGSYFLNGLSLFDSPVVFPRYAKVRYLSFMSGCQVFNQPIILPEAISGSTGSNVFRGCSAFNQDIVIPTSIDTIGPYFLYGASNFAGSIVIPSSVSSIGAYFCYDTKITTLYYYPASNVFAASNYSLGTSTTSNPQYSTGVNIYGANASAVTAALANRTSSPYRKLIAHDTPSSVSTATRTGRIRIESPLTPITPSSIIPCGLGGFGDSYGSTIWRYDYGEVNKHGDHRYYRSSPNQPY